MSCGQAGAAGAIAGGHDCWGSLLFCLSLNHKQMSMYYAPAFFAHLLGKCLRKPTTTQKVIPASDFQVIVSIPNSSLSAYASPAYEPCDATHAVILCSRHHCQDA